MLTRYNFISLILLADLLSPVQAQLLPHGEGKLVVESACSTCHSLTNITDMRRTSAQWEYIITMMVSYGANLSDNEIETVLLYLNENFGKESNL